MCASVGLNYSNQTVMHGMENARKKLHYINSYVQSRNFTLAS